MKTLLLAFLFVPLFAQESRWDYVSLDGFKTSDRIVVAPIRDAESGGVLEIDISQITKNTNLEGGALTGNFVYGAIKDSRMLNTDLGAIADYYEWTERTVEGHLGGTKMSDDRNLLMGRCWAIAVYNLYAYFYGTLWTGKSNAITQDEIVFWGKVFQKGSEPNAPEKDSINNIFEKGTASGVGDDVVRFLVDFIFDDNNAKLQTDVSFEYYREQLRKGKPIPISFVKWDGGHFALVVGLATDAQGDTLIRVANVDNFGNVIYAPINTIAATAISYEIPTKFKTTEQLYPVNKDSDGDGVVDFDEAYRFHTDVHDWDSDDDGISDFNEIYSYTIRNPIDANEGRRFQMADIVDADGDLLRPEKDADSDNDGVKDGDEDKNGNGIYEPNLGESDPYSKKINAVEDVPGDFTFYARRYFALNDGSICFLGLCGCRVASEGNLNGSAVNIGARSALESVHAKNGKVWLRDAANVQFVYMYVDGLSYRQKDTLVNKQGAARLKYSVYPSERSWNLDEEYAKELPNYAVDSFDDKILSNGKCDTLRDGDSIRFLKVESNSTLYIDKGEMFVGDVQLESGSTIAFLNSGYSTILHLNGSVIWRSSIKVFGDSAQAIQERKRIAKGFKIIQHQGVTMNIEGDWSGTIFSPNGNLILCQASVSKTIYGRFLANYISVHQNARVYSVAYNPLPENQVLVYTQNKTYLNLFCQNGI